MLKAVILLSLLMLAVASDKSGRGACPRSVSLSAYAQKNARFDPDGSFWIIGDHGDGFSDFGGINLNAKRLRRLPASGIQLNDGKTFRFKTLNVRRDNFTFTTVSIGGVYYSFAGRFLRGGVFAATDLSDERPVLEGVLRKHKAGKKVAEAKLQFMYFGGT